MTKYKYSRIKIFNEYSKEYCTSQRIKDMLLAKQPKQKSTGKVWFEEIPEENILVKKLSKSKPIRPTLQPIEEIKGNYPPYVLTDKLNQCIQHINYLLEKEK